MDKIKSACTTWVDLGVRIQQVSIANCLMSDANDMYICGSGSRSAAVSITVQKRSCDWW